MNTIAQLKQSDLAKEYASNKRLQWLMFIVVLIVVVSLSKTLLEPLTQRQLDVKQQAQLLERLKGVQSISIEPQLEQQALSQFSALSNAIPSATSSSTAEARALSEIEGEVGQYISRRRLNLIGSETIALPTSTGWSVRIDLAGQIEEVHIPKLLDQLDTAYPHRRVVSLQYSPKASGNINIVVDVLYLGESRE